VGFAVPASSIVSRLTEALELLDARGTGLPSCITFVRGPSRSADIGSTTCFGAHGPGQVWIWVLEDE
jgi:L-lactate dehydrogenase complex protein LldG